MIKSLVVEADLAARYRRIKNALDAGLSASAKKFLKNLRGVVNYAVPHDGSCLESYFTIGHNLFRQVKLAEFMKNLQPFQRRMAQLSVSFDEIIDEEHIPVHAFAEGRPLKELVSNDFLC